MTGNDSTDIAKGNPSENPNGSSLEESGGDPSNPFAPSLAENADEESLDNWGNSSEEMKSGSVRKESPAFFGDRQFYRYIVLILGTVSISGTLGIAILAAFGKEIPGSLTAIVSGAIGSLGTTISQKSN